MNDPFAVRKHSRPPHRKNRTPSPGFLRAIELDIIEHLEFFQAFMREPASIGALSPSSRALAKAMIEGFPLGNADLIVELGAGTGAFTGLILERIGKRTTFVAMELDPIHARGLNRRFPGLKVYNDSAERLAEYLALQEKQRAGYIVSGLPWANIPPEEQDRIMDAVLACLAPDGIFTTFAYLHARWLPKARQFRKALGRRFAHIETSPVVWRNLPPAFVYRCSGAHSSPALALGN
jgi:phosphatidylethanolamine/phosphatidyl-N-methylethanolamine N-methyltransferase